MSGEPHWTLAGSASGAWASAVVEPRIECVLAPNPSAMTLDGTNTWVIGEPGCGRVVVLDPGPDDVRHRTAVRAVAERRDARVDLILLTHGHLDHSEGAKAMAQEWGVPVRALASRWCRSGSELDDGDRLEIAGVELLVLATPGHTADSLSLLLAGAGGTEDHKPADSGSAQLFTGDTVLGRGTAVIAHPDGTLAAYLASLNRLRTVVTELDVTRLLPGHGPALDQPKTVLEAYLRHRAERLDAVRAAIAAGARNSSEVVKVVYADVDPALWPAAELSVAAQLDYLAAHQTD